MQARLDAASAAGQCGGAHMALIDRFVQKHGKVGAAGSWVWRCCVQAAVAPIVRTCRAVLPRNQANRMPSSAGAAPPAPPRRRRSGPARVHPPTPHAPPPPPQDGWAVGGQLSVADVYLFDLFDLHRRKFGERVDALFPTLAAHSEKVKALPGVAAYLASDKRPEN